MRITKKDIQNSKLSKRQKSELTESQRRILCRFVDGIARPDLSCETLELLLRQTYHKILVSSFNELNPIFSDTYAEFHYRRRSKEEVLGWIEYLLKENLSVQAIITTSRTMVLKQKKPFTIEKKGHINFNSLDDFERFKDNPTFTKAFSAKRGSFYFRGFALMNYTSEKPIMIRDDSNEYLEYVIKKILAIFKLIYPLLISSPNKKEG